LVAEEENTVGATEKLRCSTTTICGGGEKPIKNRRSQEPRKPATWREKLCGPTPGYEPEKDQKSGVLTKRVRAFGDLYKPISGRKQT